MSVGGIVGPLSETHARSHYRWLRRAGLPNPIRFAKILLNDIRENVDISIRVSKLKYANYGRKKISIMVANDGIYVTQNTNLSWGKV